MRDNHDGNKKEKMKQEDNNIKKQKRYNLDYNEKERLKKCDIKGKKFKPDRIGDDE